MNGECIKCKFYKSERDQARYELGQRASEEERAYIKRLKMEIRKMQLALEDRNRQLDAMSWVWCDGGCPKGVHRFDGKGPEGITQEVVDTAVRNTERLERWWRNHQYRKEREG